MLALPAAPNMHAAAVSEPPQLWQTWLAVALMMHDAQLTCCRLFCEETELVCMTQPPLSAAHGVRRQVRQAEHCAHLRDLTNAAHLGCQAEASYLSHIGN